MSELKEKYIGESKMKDTPNKKLHIKLGDKVVTTEKIADKAVTKDKMADKSVGLPELAPDVHQALASVHKGGIAVTNDFGDSEYVGISQKTLTEMKRGLDADVSTINGIIGEDENEGTLKGRIGALEQSDVSIIQKIATEKARAEAAETALQNGIEGLTQSDIVIGALPSSGVAGKIYRVPGESSYKDYAWNGSRFVELASYGNGIDEEPTVDSENLVKSGGVYKAKEELAERSDNIVKSMTNAIDTADIRVNISGLTITDGVVVVAPSSNQSKYYVRYFSHAFQKGDVIHKHNEASVSRTIKWGFTSINPADYIEEHGNLVGLELDNTGSSTGLVHEMNLCIPYDNAYFVMYYYNADWISGVTVEEFYPIHGLKGTLGTLRSDIDADHDTLENDVLKAIEEDYTNIGTWRSGGTAATYQEYSNIVTEDDVTTINIVKSASGGRFGIAFSTFPMGDYRIEFDYEIVNKSGVAVERIFSNVSYNAYNNSDSAADSRVSKYMSDYHDGHYVYRLKHLNTLGFYLAFTINNYFYTGDVMTVRNFKITKYDNDWKAVRDSVEENKSAVEGIVDSLVKAKAVGVNEITLTPSASETYLAYKTSSGSQFVSNGKRLLYFPKVVVAGGNAVTFRYTGRNTVDVYQLAEKEAVGIDDSPVGKYTVTEVMLAYKYCPSKESSNFDGNVDEDGNITVSFVAHKDCSRIAFVMGSTENKSQTPTNISENILELHLPVYDNTKVDFSSFAKKDSLLALQEKVDANDVASLESPSYNTWKKYEMAADGTITYHSNSATYITYSYSRLFKKGDRVHFYGEHVNQSGRARRWGLSSVDPLTVTDLRELEIDVETLTVTASSEIVYDDDGNYVKTIINQDITMGSDGYLLTYNYNADWLVRKVTFYYVGTLPATIEALAELAEEGGNISNDIQQSKFHSETDGMTTSLGLLHFSDIHGDSVAAAQVLKYFEKYGDYINDIVTTGDVVNYDVNTGSQITWWKNIGLAESSLFVLGNHDCATKTATEYDQVEAQSGGRAWNGMGRQWGHDTFFAPYFEDLGVVLPNGYDDPASQHYKACYWHKDYETQKIRLIGLDCMNYFDGVLDENLNVVTPGFKNISNIGQEVWFAEKLAEAKTNGYSVVVMCHYPLDDTDTTPGVSHANILDGNGCNTNADGGFVMNRLTGDTTNFTLFMSNETVAIDADKRFCLRNRVGAGTFDPLNTWVNYTKGNTNNIGDILQRYIDGGGKFVAWLCGHYHTYHMFYPKKYPTVLNVVVGQAGNSRGGNWAYRPSSDPILRTLANYVSVDAEDGLIKFVRLGLTSNRRLRKVNYLCYDYVNKRVISEG